MLARIDNSDAVNSVAFSGDGQQLIFGTGAGSVSRLFLTAKPFDAPQAVPLADLVRNPSTPKNLEMIRRWRDKSLTQLHYKVDKSDIVPLSAAEVAKAKKQFFASTGGPETIELDAHNAVSFANAANKGYSRWQGRELLMVPDKKNGGSQAVFLLQDVSPPFIVDFEYFIKNAEGPYQADWRFQPADGLVFMFLKDRSPYASAEPPAGDKRAFVDGSGYGIHFQILATRSIYLTGSSAAQRLTSWSPSLAYRLPDVYTDGEWRRVRVAVMEDSVAVTYEGVVVLQWKGALDTKFKGVGFGAANGGADSDHRIRDVKVTLVRTPVAK
jgi:hypothetical protein